MPISRPSNNLPTIHWTEGGESCAARWRSEAGVAPPGRIQVADDTLSADAAYRLACEGTALLWRGDFQNARQLLQAMARRFDRKPQSRTSHSHTSRGWPLPRHFISSAWRRHSAPARSGCS